MTVHGYVVCTLSLFCWAAVAAPAGSIVGYTVSPDIAGQKTGLTSGKVIETSETASHIRMTSGTKLDVGTDSKGQLFGDHFVLQKGISQADGTDSHFYIRANGMDVAGVPDSPARYRVAMLNPQTILVTAIQGDAEVRNTQGMLMALVVRGTAMEVAQQSGAAAASQYSGCVQMVGSNYVIRDAKTNVVIELMGSNVGQYAGKNVTVSGSLSSSATPIQGAAQVLEVSNVMQIGGKGCQRVIAAATAATSGAAAGIAGAAGGAAGAAAGGAAGAAGAAAGAAAGVASGAAAIGVAAASAAAAATVGGLAASGALTPTPASGSTPGH